MTNLQNFLEENFSREELGKDPEGFLAKLKELIFTWQIKETDDPAEADIIMGFSFGYILDQNGNRLPGEINRQLADRIVRYHNDKPRTVYAQWEIADSIGDRLADVVSIGPDIDKEKGEVKYLSTKDVLRKMKEHMESSGISKVGPILVVAHSMHLFRCAKLVREQGYSVRTDQSNMPTGFDANSAQPWTRNVRIYIISEIISRLVDLRNEQKSSA